MHKILLAIPKTTLRDTIGLVVERQAECQIFTASDGEEAISAFKEHLPRLFILDLHQPRLNGFDVLRYLKANDFLKDSAVILISSMCYPETVRQAAEVGASDFLAKPVNVELLAERVRRYLGVQPEMIVSAEFRET